MGKKVGIPIRRILNVTNTQAHAYTHSCAHCGAPITAYTSKSARTWPKM